MSRIQWLERTVPADGDEIGRYLGEAWARETVPSDSLAMQSYLELTSSAPAATTDHELFVCLQIDAKRAWRQIKRTGGKQGADAGACAVLLRELEALAERLAGADVRVVGALRPGVLAAAVRVAFDPWSRPDSHGSRQPTRTGTASTRQPRGHSGRRRRGASTNGRSVPCDLLDRQLAARRRRCRLPLPLLLHAQMVRAIAVTIEPISPLKAIREVEAARTSDEADRELVDEWASWRPPGAGARPRRSPAARRSSPTDTRPFASQATSPSQRARSRSSNGTARSRARRPDVQARTAPAVRTAGRGVHLHTLPLCRGLQ